MFARIPSARKRTGRWERRRTVRKGVEDPWVDLVCSSSSGIDAAAMEWDLYTTLPGWHGAVVFLEHGDLWVYFPCVCGARNLRFQQCLWVLILSGRITQIPSQLLLSMLLEVDIRTPKWLLDRHLGSRDSFSEASSLFFIFLFLFFSSTLFLLSLLSFSPKSLLGRRCHDMHGMIIWLC